MNVICPSCSLEYDDAYCWTNCPHETFEMHCTVFINGQMGCAHTVEEQLAAIAPEPVLPNPDCLRIEMVRAFAEGRPMRMLARQMAEQFGDKLIGRTVCTRQNGNWPGGPAVVVEMCPDPECPDIVFTVWNQRNGTIGVLENEEITL